MATTTTPTVASTSKQWTLRVADFLKALAVAGLTTPVSIILSSISAGTFTIDWTSIWHLAAGGAAAYLLKNFVTPSQTVITGVQPGSTTTVTVPPAGTSTTQVSVK
jgi:hypothetical protein